MAPKSNFAKLMGTTREAELQNVWNKIFKMTDKVKLSANTDGVFDGKLFEFKYEANFFSRQWNRSAYKALAQSIYYLHKISQMKYEGIDKLPNMVIVIEKTSAFVVPTQQLERILYDNEAGLKVDWRRAPSCPDKNLVNWLERKSFFETYNIKLWRFHNDNSINSFYESIITSNFDGVKIQITEYNFVKIFKIWKDLFCDTNLPSDTIADHYVLDINLKFQFFEKTNTLYSRDTNEEWQVPREKYISFWNYYKRPPSVRVQQYIIANKDRLYDVDTRYNTGDFYTPLVIAEKARKYLKENIPSEIMDTSIWWDPAAGGANLFIDAENKSNVILSTLLDRDLRTLRQVSLFNNSIIEKYNFIKSKDIPDGIKQKLGDYPLIFLLNPPFNDQSGHTLGRQNNPNQIDKNFVDENDLSEIPNPRRNLRGDYSKFLYRIYKIMQQFSISESYVGIFTKSTWLSGIDYSPFRLFWRKRFEFRSGFIIPSKVFECTKGDWPVLFSVWKLREKILYNSRDFEEISFEVFNKDLDLIGEKSYSIGVSNQKCLTSIINKKCLKEKKIKTCVPLKNECDIYDGEEIYCQTIHEGSFGYMTCIANDIQHSDKKLSILSAPYGGSHGNGFSIVEENFENALAVYGIRKSVKKSWLNDKDEFYIRSETVPTKEFKKLKRRAILWSILDGSYTSSLKNIQWNRKKYEIKNHLFALTLNELKVIQGVDANLLPEKDSKAASWLSSKLNKQEFDKFDIDAIDAYKNLMVATFTSGNRQNANPKHQCTNPDASPRQLINGLFNFDGVTLTKDEILALKNYSEKLAILKNKIYETSVKLNIFTETTLFEKVDDDTIVESTSRKVS